MRYSDIVQTLLDTWDTDPTLPAYISGPPGVGKTSLAYTLAERMGLDPRPHHEGGQVVIFRPSLRDPVDLLGTPAQDLQAQETRWLPPSELKKLQQGEWLFVVDELPQGERQMQNALAGLMLDRFVGELRLSPGVRVLSTGNRTKDKAGANRIVSQLGNRVMHLEMELDLNEWCEWAIATPGLDIMGVAFMRFRTEALLDFDPDRLTNATPRAWERVMRLDRNKFSPDRLLEAVSGLVNEGRAAEYTGFISLLGRVASPDQIILDPHNTPVPEEPDVSYACMAALTTRTTADNFDAIMTYVERMPQDYQVLYVKGAMNMSETLMSTRRFIEWSTKNHAVFQ